MFLSLLMWNDRTNYYENIEFSFIDHGFWTWNDGLWWSIGKHPATVQLCAVQLAQQGAVHREPLRVAVGGRNGIPLRGKQLAEGLVLQSCFRQPGHVPHGGNMFWVVQARGVAEMRGGHPQLCRFLVHPGHKGGQVAVRNITGDHAGRVVGAGHQQAVQQVDAAHRFTDAQVDGAAVGVLDVLELLGQAGGDGDLSVHVLAALEEEQSRHHLGESRPGTRG